MLPLRETSASGEAHAAPDSHRELPGALAPRAALDAMMAMMSACAPQGTRTPRRWRAFATAIARTVELPEPLVEQFEHCALLHDIGKLAIPDPEIRPTEPRASCRHAAPPARRIGFDILSVVPTPATRCRAADRGVRAVGRIRYPAGCAAGRFRSARASWRSPMPTTSSQPSLCEGLSRDEANAEIVRSPAPTSTRTSCAPGCAPRTDSNAHNRRPRHRPRLGRRRLSDGRRRSARPEPAVRVRRHRRRGDRQPDRSARRCSVLKDIVAQIKRRDGPWFNQDDYLDLLSLLYLVFKQVQQSGVMSLEAHFEDPIQSPILSSYPKFLARHRCGRLSGRLGEGHHRRRHRRARSRSADGRGPRGRTMRKRCGHRRR